VSRLNPPVNCIEFIKYNQIEEHKTQILGSPFSRCPKHHRTR
jgi:hypothetical protein